VLTALSHQLSAAYLRFSVAAANVPLRRAGNWLAFGVFAVTVVEVFGAFFVEGDIPTGFGKAAVYLMLLAFDRYMAKDLRELADAPPLRRHPNRRFVVFASFATVTAVTEIHGFFDGWASTVPQLILLLVAVIVAFARTRPPVAQLLPQPARPYGGVRSKHKTRHRRR
jgi:hypothetical protein